MANTPGKLVSSATPENISNGKTRCLRIRAKTTHLPDLDSGVTRNMSAVIADMTVASSSSTRHSYKKATPPFLRM